MKKLCNREGQPISAQNVRRKGHSVLFLTVFFVFLGLSFGAFAVELLAQKPVFFEALYDVPVMGGLQEQEAETLVFDKPDGKIASVTAISQTLSKAQVEAFYAQTLPQMGWKKIDYNQYVRDKDVLIIEMKSQASTMIAQFTLRPVQ